MRGSLNARPAANPEELEDRAGDYGGRRPAGGVPLLFAADRFGGNTPAGTGHAAGGVEAENGAGGAAEGSSSKSSTGRSSDLRFLQAALPYPGIADFDRTRQTHQRQWGVDRARKV